MYFTSYPFDKHNCYFELGSCKTLFGLPNVKQFFSFLRRELDGLQHAAGHARPLPRLPAEGAAVHRQVGAPAQQQDCHVVCNSISQSSKLNKSLDCFLFGPCDRIQQAEGGTANRSIRCLRLQSGTHQEV